MSLPLTAEKKPFIDRVKQVYCLYFSTLKRCMKLMLILFALGVVVEGGALVFGVHAQHAGNIGLIYHILASAFFLPAVFYIAKKLTAGDAEGMDGAVAFAKGKILVCLAAIIIFMLAFLLGSALLVIPGIYIFIASFNYFPMVILEGASPLNGLMDACRLLWGNAWRSLGILLLSLIPVYIAVFAMQFVIGVLFGVSLVFLGHPIPAAGNLTLDLFACVIGWVFNAFLIFPLTPALAMIVHRDNAVRSQG